MLNENDLSAEPKSPESTKWKKLLSESKIPDKKILYSLEHRLASFDSAIDKNSPGVTELVEDYIKLNEERYLDQRKIFRDSDGNGTVFNKNYVKVLSKNLIAEGKTNFSRIALDVEGLKTVNDIMGHEQGDRYLKAVYDKLVEAIKEAQKEIALRFGEEVRDQVEFIISAEGGDEFGVMVIAPEDSELKVTGQEFSFSETGKESGRIRLSELVVTLFHDKLAEVDCHEFVDTEKIREKYLKGLRDQTQDHAQQIKNAVSIDDGIFKELAAKYSSEIKNSGQEPEKMELSERKDFFEGLVAANQAERENEIERKFKDYEFFASASAGVLDFSETGWLDSHEIDQRTEEMSQKSDVDQNEAASWAKADLFFSSADTRLDGFKGLNPNKAFFKKNLFKAGRLADDTELGRQWRNLATHSEVLSRNDEMSELIREFQKVTGENERLAGELVAVKEELKVCLGSK